MSGALPYCDNWQDGWWACLWYHSSVHPKQPHRTAASIAQLRKDLKRRQTPAARATSKGVLAAHLACLRLQELVR